MTPQIVSSYQPGAHNENIAASIERLEQEGAYRDLSTIIVVPALGTVPTKVVASWMNMYNPPNQRIVRMFAMGMEVGAAYSRTIEQILANPDLAKYKYLITLEADNVPPPDGVPKLLNQMERHPEYAVISGLYFTKGPGGCAQIWGDTRDPVLNFRPLVPQIDQLIECCGTGMGFAAWRLDIFKDEKLRRPWFQTTSSQSEGCYTQDLFFFTDARKYGYRCAVDCSIRVGHFDHLGKFGPAEFCW